MSATVTCRRCGFVIWPTATPYRVLLKLVGVVKNEYTEIEADYHAECAAAIFRESRQVGGASP